MLDVHQRAADLLNRIEVVSLREKDGSYIVPPTKEFLLYQFAETLEAQRLESYKEGLRDFKSQVLGFLEQKLEFFPKVSSQRWVTQDLEFMQEIIDHIREKVNRLNAG